MILDENGLSKLVLSDEEILSADLSYGELPTKSESFGIIDYDDWLEWYDANIYNTNKFGHIESFIDNIGEMVSYKLQYIKTPTALYNGVAITAKSFKVTDLYEFFLSYDKDSTVFLYDIEDHESKTITEILDETDFLTVIKLEPPQIIPEFYIVRIAILGE